MWLAELRCGGFVKSASGTRPCRRWLGAMWSYRDDLVVSPALSVAAFSMRFLHDESRVLVAVPVKIAGAEPGPPELYVWRDWLDVPWFNASDLKDKRRRIDIHERLGELGFSSMIQASDKSSPLLDRKGGLCCAKRHEHPIELVTSEPWCYDWLSEQVRLSRQGSVAASASAVILMPPAPHRGRRPRRRHEPDDVL